MAKKKHSKIDCQRIELGGTSYVILRDSDFQCLCRMGGVEQDDPSAEQAPGIRLDLDRASLAERLIKRRRVAGLSQAELARRAGIRPETLNRIERGRTTPDFSTVRKLVVAMNEAEEKLQHDN